MHIGREAKHGKQEGLLHPIDKEGVPLQTFHIDHQGPITSTSKQYKHVLVVIDAFTKFTWIFPTKSTTTSETVSKLKIIQETFGNPKRIISDRGTSFSSKEFAEYCESEGIDHHMVTTGMPRGNGQVERTNRCIIPILTKASMEDPTKWYRHVSSLQRSLNSTYHRSISTSPFKLMFGVEMRRKEDLQMLEILEEEFVSQFMEERNESREVAKAQILRVQDENRKQFNKKRKPAVQYKLGDIVAVKRTQFVNGNKLAPKYLGPYRISKVLPNERYEVSKQGHHEGPKQTSTAAEYLKPWSSGADEL